jgi:hypothetical protein
MFELKISMGDSPKRGAVPALAFRWRSWARRSWASRPRWRGPVWSPPWFFVCCRRLEGGHDFFCQQPLMPFLLHSPPFLLVILFLSTVNRDDRHLLAHEWPLTSQSHCIRQNFTILQYFFTSVKQWNVHLNSANNSYMKHNRLIQLQAKSRILVVIVVIGKLSDA